MTSSRSRVLVWTGPVFAVAFLLVDLLTTGGEPGEKASAAKVLGYFHTHETRTLVQAFAAPALAALVILFAGELRARARERGENGAGSMAMIGGAVLWAAGMLGGAVVDLALVTAAQHHLTDAAQTLNVLNNDDWMPFIAGLAMFLIGAGITTLRSGLLPRWLGYVAVVIGVIALAGPGGFIGYFVAPVWIIIAGVMLATRSGDSQPQLATTAPQHATSAGVSTSG